MLKVQKADLGTTHATSNFLYSFLGNSAFKKKGFQLTSNHNCCTDRTFNAMFHTKTFKYFRKTIAETVNCSSSFQASFDTFKVQIDQLRHCAFEHLMISSFSSFSEQNRVFLIFCENFKGTYYILAQKVNLDSKGTKRTLIYKIQGFERIFSKISGGHWQQIRSVSCSEVNSFFYWEVM